MKIHLQRETRVLNDGTPITLVRGINRGMIFWVDLPEAHAVGSEQYKRRPWVVVSADSVHQRMPIVQAVPLSTRLHKAKGFLASRIEVASADVVANEEGAALKGDAVALTEQVRVLAHERLDGQPAGRCSQAAMSRIDAGLRFVLRL